MNRDYFWLMGVEYKGIDLFWGDETAGLCHIIKEREKRGTNGSKFVGVLTDVVEMGTAFPNKNQDRINISYKGRIAVIAFDLRGTETSALLTAYHTKNKD